EEVLEDIKNQINAAQVGVSASVIESKDGEKQLILTSKQTGEANRMTLGTAYDGTNVLEDSGGLLSSLGLIQNDEGTSKLNAAQDYQNAEIVLNGVNITRSSNTLTNVIEGATITLLKESDSKEGGYSARAKLQIETD